MMTSPAAALAELELGHLKPVPRIFREIAPSAPEALKHTTTAIWSDLFATLTNTSLERYTRSSAGPSSIFSIARPQRSMRRSTG